jgi:hypothetical protein
VFAGLINQAKAAASGLVLKYVARAAVAIPFVIALGFALAAIAAMLVERFGHVAGYGIMAGGLALIGVIAAIVVSVKEHEDEVADKKAEESDTQQVARDATVQAITQAPLCSVRCSLHLEEQQALSRSRDARAQFSTHTSARPDRCVVLADGRSRVASRRFCGSAKGQWFA